MLKSNFLHTQRFGTKYWLLTVKNCKYQYWYQPSATRISWNVGAGGTVCVCPTFLLQLSNSEWTDGGPREAAGKVTSGLITSKNRPLCLWVCLPSITGLTDCKLIVICRDTVYKWDWLEHIITEIFTQQNSFIKSCYAKSFWSVCLQFRG